MWRTWSRSLGVAGSACSACSAWVVSSKRRASQCETYTPKPRKSVNQRLAQELPGLDGLGLNSQHMSIFTRSGQRVSCLEILEAAHDSNLVLIGETHDDPVAHQMELLILASLHKLGPCALSMEMFESDVQGVLDEYLAGMIDEDDFMKDARPWPNYVHDYRLLVEFAKEVSMPVIAANIPRRYVRAVGREGPCTLTSSWPSSPFSWLPRLSMPAPSISYLEHIQHVIGAVSPLASLGQGCPCTRRPNEFTSAVILWDSAMAHAISKQLSAQPERRVVHVCGSFHCERNLGIYEMLSHYRESTSTLVIAMYPEEDCHEFDEARHGGMADFVILTDAALPRSIVR